MSKGKSKGKTNPRNQPRTEADVRRAKSEGRDEGIELTLTVMLYVLADKFGFSDEQISRASQWFNVNAAAILAGDIKFGDMKKLLKDEYGWELNLAA